MAERLAARIDRLAQRFGTPRFRPHATLLGAMACRGEAEACMERLATPHPPMTLPVEGIDGAEAPFRVFYLRLGQTPELTHLRKTARARCPHGETRPWFPHLSLLYGTLDRSTRQRLAAEWATGLPDRIPFDRIALVDARGPVSQWRVLAAAPLGAG